MAHVVTQPCCNDASCVEACPVNCIHPTPDEPGYAVTEMLYIDPDTCIDCGACVDVCPVNAISPDYELPEDALRYAELNARYFADPAHQGYSEEPAEPRKRTCEVSGSAATLQVAIVGSGPAACYAAEELLTVRGCDVEVHMFERLATPWGLVRHGVAPDHPDTKRVSEAFARTAARRQCTLYLNVEIGTHLTHDELLDHHHAVIYAVGAAHDRQLAIPGEQLPGSRSATEFVGWYNGHPDFAESSFDLSAERAVVVGNGNVALDVARILATDVQDLARTDIAEHALDALSTSRVREIVVLGRRGPAQAAYTTPELLELTRVSAADVRVDPGEAKLDAPSEAAVQADPSSASRSKCDLVSELAAAPLRGKRKRVVLRYLTSPVEILGEDGVRGVRAERNELVDSGDGVLLARPTGDTEELDCGLVLRSIGYHGHSSIPGLPFDDACGTLPVEQGRVIDQGTQQPLPGVYSAGWIKRGPSGGIGTNRQCAKETVDNVLDDYAHGRLSEPKNTTDAVGDLVHSRQPEALSYNDWKVLDAHERSEGKDQGRPRAKLVDIGTMLDLLERSG